jgi:hypothetical protein
MQRHQKDVSLSSGSQVELAHGFDSLSSQVRAPVTLYVYISPGHIPRANSCPPIMFPYFVLGSGIRNKTPLG